MSSLVQTFSRRRPASSHSDSSALAWSLTGLFAYLLAGYFVPSVDYRIETLGWVFGLIYVVGLAVVAALGGRFRALMVATFGTYAVIVSVVMVLATWNASRMGAMRPIWLIDRNLPRDDYYVFEFAIRPFIGKRDLDLYPGRTNAPLFWYANVKLQELMVRTTGAPVPFAGLATNVVVGSTMAAFTVGAIARSLSTLAGKGIQAKHLSFIVFACPWTIAASVICIREVWVYCVFACSIYVGLTISTWRLALRLGALTATVAVLGPACYLLRTEMVGLWLLLLLIVAFETKDSNATRPASHFLRFALLGLIALVVYNAISPQAFDEKLRERAAQYAVMTEHDEMRSTDQGIVRSLVQQGPVLRAVILSTWMWFSPLPKLALVPGSLYTAGQAASGFWIIGCLALARGGLRTQVVPERDRDPGATEAVSVSRRFGLHILWFVVFTFSVGVSSSETRHAYAAMPLAALLLANLLHTRCDLRQLRTIQRRAALTTFGFFVAFALFTLTVFGSIEI